MRSIRSDLTRRLAPGLTLAVGLHLARYENSRAENVESELSFLGEAFPEVLESQSRVEGWLYGPSVGLRGSLALGASSRVGLSIFQSVLFTEVDLEASWTGTSEFPFESNLTIDSTSSSRSAVPVTDVRAALTVGVSRNVSIGAFALLSVWLDLPQAGSFSISRERWEATKSTLVFASVGPVVRVGF